MRIHRGGVEVYPRLAAAEHDTAFEPGHLKSGVAALDALLGDGVDIGSSTLVVGPAGSGKSTLALQYARAAARTGGHARIFTFGESRKMMLARLAALGMGVEEGNGAGQVAVCQVDPAEISPGQFAHMVRHDVRTAYDEPSGIATARTLLPHAVFCDIGMPGMNGHEVAMTLRNGVLPTAASIAVTGWGADEDRRKAQDAGFDFHLVKPVDSRAIDAVLEKL